MKTVYKYELKLNIEDFYVTVPRGAQFISAINQFDRTVIYAIVDPSIEEMVEKKVYLFGTGFKILESEYNDIINSDKYQFLNTISQNNGNLIWHVWVEK